MQRDLSIDILRFIALSGIILVHINPSLFWCQLRSFDVLLIVLSLTSLLIYNLILLII